MRIKFVAKIAFLLLSSLCLLPEVSAKTIFNYHDVVSNPEKTIKTNEAGGIKETIPIEFQNRYQAWKGELLSTEFGKSLWAKYENKKDFVLTIEVGKKNYKGAGTIDFLWDDKGLFVGATIYLGGKIDKGFPDPIYYPVMNSISEFNDRKEISGNVLAATKFAHEFGHINLTFESNQEKFKLENKLMPLYNSIFLGNGFNVKDQRLLDIANQLGGTPTKIWENREYWGEATAMSFILERTYKKTFYCSLIKKINENVNRYAKGYEARFNQISELKSSENCQK